MGMVGAEDSTSQKQANAAFAATLSARLTRITAGWERLLALGGIAAFLVGTMPDLGSRTQTDLTMVCVLVSLLFALQYALGLLRAADRRKWAASGHALIDLVAAVPIPLLLAAGS